MNLKTLRESRQLTQTELAKLADTTPDVICRLESGDREPTAKMIPKLAKALRCTIAELWK